MSEGHRAELVDVIREVRRRWRIKLAVRGAAIAIGGTVLALLVSASGLEALRFSSHAIIAFRILILLTVAALLARWVVAPLLRRLSHSPVSSSPGIACLIARSLRADCVRTRNQA